MMGGGRGLGLLLLIPAGILLMLGATIILAPGILTWLVAGSLIAVGGVILVAAFHTRRPSSRAA